MLSALDVLTMPDHFRDTIARLSRQRTFVIRAGLAMLALAVLASWIISVATNFGKQTKHNPKAELARTVEELIELVRFHPDFFEADPLKDCRDLITEPIPPVQFENWTRGLASSTPEETLAMVGSWFRALRGSGGEEDIEKISETSPGTRHREEFLGDILFSRGDQAGALSAYRRELEQYPEALYSRRSMMTLIRTSGDRAALQIALKNSENRAAIVSGDLLPALTDARLYHELFIATLRREAGLLASPAALPTLFGAFVWIGILFAFWNITRQRLVMATGALLAGMVGAVLSFFVQLLQERIGEMTFVETAPPLSQFLHFVAGTGLREETFKLVVAFPFVWWSARHRSDTEALIVAGMVGLGFVTQQSLTDFTENFATAAPWTRLLTENGLHVALTGLAGWAISRCCARKGRGWEDALVYFLAIVLVNAFFEALHAMPLLQDYSPLSSIFIAVVAYRYFDQLREHRENSQASRRVSPLGIFVLGTTALAGFVLIGSAAVVPYHFALGIFFASIGSLIPLAFAYISRFRDL
jgi:RsiW-degrading membrane proteinase PrsW (M82 family)